MHLLLSGGDTGGHLYMASAIIEYLRAHAPSSTAAFAGAAGRLPMGNALPPDIRTFSLGVLPFDREHLPGNVRVALAAALGIRESFRILSAERPDAVVGLGGYPSGPFVYAAALKKIPALIMEPNIRPGLANRLLAKRVDRICTAFEETAAFFPRGKVAVTGTPVRESLSAGLPDKELSRTRLGLRPGLRTCLVIGGSLGSGKLNDTILASAADLAGRDIQILWQTGHEQFASVKAALDPAAARACTVVPFIDDMALAYAAADLVISAAGAMTIAELAASGMPAIIIPSAGVTENHQYYNARHLAGHGACAMLQEHDIAEQLLPAIVACLASQERLRLMRGRIRELARPGAAGRIVDELLRLCGPRQAAHG